jgi:hypothetical protein
MWKSLGVPKVERLTKRLAKYYAEMEPAPNDRPLSRKRIEMLRKEVNEERFRTCEWAEATCGETAKLYRINGKHTSTLFNEMNGEFPTEPIHVICQRYECDTLADVASLYSTFDSKISSRSQQDINRIFAAAHPDLKDIPARIISRCVTGMSYAVWGLKGDSGVSQEKRAQLLIEHPNFVLWFVSVLTADAQFLNRGPVVAAMFQTYQKAQRDSNEFWVRDGSGARPTAPDRKLQKYLLQTSVGVGAGCRSEKERDDSRAMYCRCVHAWNAWRRGDTTDLKYYAKSKLPAAV